MSLFGSWGGHRKTKQLHLCHLFFLYVSAWVEARAAYMLGKVLLAWLFITATILYGDTFHRNGRSFQTAVSDSYGLDSGVPQA